MTSISVKLSEPEQDRLIRAIESAMEVSRREDFLPWIRREFHALLPHESLVCMEIDEHGLAHHIECLQHSLADARMIEFLCNPLHGLALRLVRSLPATAQMSRMLDAAGIHALLASGGHAHAHPEAPHNVVVHRIKFVSGVAYFFVLFNVPEDQVPRSLYLFKLLSSHVKMALSRAISPQEPKRPAPLTQREREILAWMSNGKSNREISAVLGISPITLKTHVTKIYRKLDVQTRAEAVLHGKCAVQPSESGQG